MSDVLDLCGPAMTGEAVGLAEGGTLVLGLGNELRGDDGLGPAVVRALSSHPELPSDVRVLDGGLAGVETVLLLKGASRAIIVDAAEQGLAPGAWQRLSGADVVAHAARSGGGSWHAAGLAEALALGQALDALPAKLVVYAVQPHRADFAPGLSEPLQAAIPELCEQILADLLTPSA